ncbi:MAG: cation transporter [Candidatus Zixiibacteriota bacterium]|nr:MAG: cation transporter [candidate division Zixibacteria bacterium]
MTHIHQKTVSGRRLFAVILLNVGITAAEFIGGLLTGYLALLADAVHNLSDVASLLLAYLGDIGSRRPPTKKSTYGFKRIEVMTAFISAVALVVIAVYIFYEAYRRFLSPIDITNPVLLLTIAAIGLVGNILSVFLLHSGKSKSLNIKAAFLHMLYDAISSAAVIIGAIVILNTGWIYIDPILSILIGLMILYSSFDVLKEATMIFLEAVPGRIDYDQVKQAMMMHPKVNGVHDLHIWSLSSNSVALSCHIQLDKEDYLASPAIISELGLMLKEKFHIGHATIQPERKNCAADHEKWSGGGCI